MKSYLRSSFTTELPHKLTMNIAGDFIENNLRGFKTLLEVENDLLEPFEKFLDDNLEILIEKIKYRLAHNKKIIFIGAGSSGRLAKTLEHIASYYNQSSQINVFGYIAGGSSAMVKAIETAEDSEFLGVNFAKNNISSGDLVFLISASGSCAYNYGVAKEAFSTGAEVFYFCNNLNEPKFLVDLISAKMVTCLKYASGPQAITGSTRLQAASLGLLCFGSLIRFVYQENFSALDLKLDLLRLSQEILTNDFLELFKKLETVHLNNEQINYVTDDVLFPVVLSDLAELSPTYSEPYFKKKNAALAEQDANLRAYTRGEIYPEIASDYEIYFHEQKKLINILEINYNKENIYFKFLGQNLFSLSATGDLVRDLYSLKICLNLISNGLMIKRNKLFGNMMIALSPSNNKLLDRSVDLARNYLLSQGIDIESSVIHEKITDILMIQKNTIFPPVIIAIIMLKFGCNYYQACELYSANNWMDKV